MKSFPEQLEQLKVELITAGVMCEEAISTAAKALLEGDTEQAAKVAPIEEELDQKERDVESLCMKLLLQEHPGVKELRRISSAMKMISDLERIGDQAGDIAELTPYLKEGLPGTQSHIRDMTQATIKMVTDSVNSFVHEDLSLARAVIKYDDVVDGLFDQVKRELIGLIGQGGQAGELYVDLLMVAKYLERIGDHAVNVAEWVQYSLTGKKGQ